MDESFVGVAAASAELVVEVCNGQLPPVPRRERVKQMKQRHRVQSPGNGHQNRLAPLEQPAVLDVVLDVLKQIAHALMLPHWRSGARAATSG